MRTARTAAPAPRLDGRTAIVTGATGGIGFQAALALARLGSETVLAARDPEKARRAEARIRASVPDARVRSALLDLGSLDSVAAFASGMKRADILINNGAVMGLPRLERTRDGFERQVGVNYLGHFALAARLLPALARASGGGRVVSVASLAHRRASLALDDFQSERSYAPMRAYGRSKLAMLMFALALQRRADAAGWPVRSIAAHPGWARTGIIPNGMGPGLPARLAALAFNAVAQSAQAGAMPLVFAATAPDAAAGGYYGPSRFGETRGPVGPARIFPQARDEAAQARLWALSESLTGLRFVMDTLDNRDEVAPFPCVPLARNE